MARIILTAFVDNKLKSLIEVLYLKGYFGFKVSAYDYVNKLYDFIDTVPEQVVRPCKNAKYGKYYVVFKMNSSTTYYITFDFSDDLYLIKNVFNNHGEEYPTFIK
jgi:hypothetical protein